MKKETMDFYRYCIGLQKGRAIAIAVEIAFFAAAVCVAKIDVINSAYSITVAVLSFAFMIKDAFSIFKACKGATFSEEAKFAHFNDCLPDDFEVKAPDDSYFDFVGFTHNINGSDSNKNMIFRSDELNLYLMSQKSLHAELDNVKYIKIRNNLKSNAKMVLPILYNKYRDSIHNGKTFSNDLKLCLSKEIPKGGTISFHKGCYYDTYLTNQTCGRALLRNSDSSVISKGIPYPITKDNKLECIDNSQMNDEIGISTLAITKDGYIVVFRQNRRALFSPDLIVPTGSGSCDASDFRDNSFSKTIIYAMNRELKEETSLDKQFEADQSIFETRIIGFFRWVQRGGKPEFIGLTKMRKHKYIDIEPQSKEVYGKDKYKAHNLEQLKESVALLQKQKDLSIPLAEILTVLSQIIENNPDYMNFLFYNYND